MIEISISVEYRFLLFCASRVRWFRNILPSWIKIHKKMQLPGSKGQNINQQLQTKIFCSQTLDLNGSSSFSIKNDAKKEEEYFEIFSSVKKSVNFKDPGSDPLFSSMDPGSGSASKLIRILSTAQKSSILF